MDKKERFNQAFKYLCYKGYAHTQKDIADKMMSSESNISKALKGNPTVLTDRFLKRFNVTFGKMFNDRWLLTGEGEMLKGGISQTATEQSAVNGNINVNGNVHESNLTTTSEKFLDLLQAKEQCLATAQENLATTQEQVNRLISIIEKMQNNH